MSVSRSTQSWIHRSFCYELQYFLRSVADYFKRFYILSFEFVFFLMICWLCFLLYICFSRPSCLPPSMFNRLTLPLYDTASRLVRKILKMHYTTDLSVWADHNMSKLLCGHLLHVFKNVYVLLRGVLMCSSERRLRR